VDLIASQTVSTVEVFKQVISPIKFHANRMVHGFVSFSPDSERVNCKKSFYISSQTLGTMY
jgi:hypothetical protein